MPLLSPLLVGECGMQDRDFVTENLVQIGGHGGSETDLRY